MNYTDHVRRRIDTTDVKPMNKHFLLADNFLFVFSVQTTDGKSMTKMTKIKKKSEQTVNEVAAMQSRRMLSVW